ncbi:SET domain-containing protein SmydA-8 [Episyrphus balteatus]|uniref:SET domain-containing protein SmydA-8 n=1 Tax=Episyrphus balteatus TaxID=286459 RepID=UPI0024868760|nr:SET domain-containing protein SmydA-8 [Episyrphus balteatus]
MQNFSELCELSIKDNKLCLKAIIDITPGDVILEEQAILMSPQWESDQMKCSNCLKSSFVMCQACLVFPLCVECPAHDQFDCEFFQRAKNIPKNILISNYTIYAPLKCLLKMENPKANKSSLIELLKVNAHLEEYLKSETWIEHKQKVVEPILQSGIVEHFQNIKVNEEILQQLCSLLDLHSYEITNRDGDQVRGIYLQAPTIPHSCIPNTLMAIDDDFNLKIYATLPIRQGELIYNSYTNPLMGTSQRQHHLKMTKFIDCSCLRCKDPTELGTYLSSVKCKVCPDGYVSLFDSKWTCENCSAIMSELDVQKLLSEVAEQILYADGDIREYETLLAKYSGDFHPNHFLMIDLKQNTASILRSILMNPMCQPGRGVIRRKIELCEQMLPVVRALQPGISRLYAIASYEYVITYVELTEYEYNDGEISTEEYEKRLIKAREMSKESIRMLAFEPPNSPEGHLMQRIAMELTQIEEYIAKSCTQQ